MARNRTFIVPVCVDTTPDAGADVPESFLRVQWTRLPGGTTPRAFVERIATLLGTSVVNALAPAERGMPVSRGLPAQVAATSRRTRLIVASLLVGLLTAALVAWQSWRMMSDRPRAPDASGGSMGKSVAVLPFADMSEKHDQEYFSDGLAEELIDVLTRIPDLRVPARTSSFSFKGKANTVGEIARALGVTHVLEGSVRKSGEHLRIAAQLVRADNGFHLWSQTYDRDVRDVFAVQDDIAHAVAEQLKISLLGHAKQTTSSEAHNLYLQARYVMDRDTPADLNQAVLLFQQALVIDPNYAPAWAWLAYCHTRRVSQGLDTTGAGYEKVTSAARRAVDLDPLNLLHRKYLGRALHYAGRPTESLAALRHAMELNPQFPGLHYEQGRALLMLNESEAARASFEDEPDPSWRSFGLPLGNLATHHDKEARAALAAIVANSPGSEFQVAETYAFFGDKDQAFYWLEQARTLHDPGIIYVRRDFLLAPLMSDPRYAAFLKRLG